MAEGVAFISALVGAASTAEAAKESRRSRKQSEESSARQRREATQLKTEVGEMKEEEKAISKRDRERRRQRALFLTSGTTGRRSTILTSNIGVSGQGSPGKTLLGL